MKLEWKHGESDCEFGHYQVRMNREGSFDALFISPRECTMVAINRIARVDVFAACQSDYDARIAAIALANGYVKVDENHIVIHQAVLLSIMNDLREKNGLAPLSADELRTITGV